MAEHLLKLLHLSDPTLPVGGFSHSAGLETYVQQEIVRNAATAKEFVVQMLSTGIHYTDAALLSLAFDAAQQTDLAQIIALDETCSAVKLPQEIRQASYKTGRRLLKIFRPLHPSGLVAAYQDAVTAQQSPGHYCIAFGLIAAAMNIEKGEALTGFYYNAAVGFVTNCVKLIPLSQQAGQEILYSLHPLIEKLAAQNMQPDADLIGLCCCEFDIKSMQHERLYSRLYMS